MIGYLSGLIIDKDPTSVLVLTGGVGYRVFATSDLIATAKSDHKIQLFIHTSVREDDISLYGFPGKDELKFFEQLLGVSGIGPKMAMEILSTPLSLTKNAIIGNDIATLTKIKGLGKKTAERLCLELHNKIDPVTGSGSSKINSTIHDEVVSALESLGYERHQIIQSMSKLPADITETEEIVKYFLKSAS
jgi:Holliday junction DNA helicase RuvA